jgi:hypothetical protein
MFNLVSTRFTNETWNINQNYREKIRHNGCIYGSPQEMSPKIQIDSIVFVVEMNNSKNQIEGIGLVKNRSHADKYYKIYGDGNYNRYIYKSEYRLGREYIIRENSSLVEILDHILFKGYTHLKRGSGFTTIPDKLLKSPICNDLNIKEEIRKIFIKYFSDKFEKNEDKGENIEETNTKKDNIENIDRK